MFPAIQPPPRVLTNPSLFARSFMYIKRVNQEVYIVTKNDEAKGRRSPHHVAQFFFLILFNFLQICLLFFFELGLAFT